MYNLNQLKNYATILKSGKETFVDVGGNMFKKVTAKEWRVRKFDDKERQSLWEKIVGEDINKAIRSLLATADLFRELGY